MRARPPWLATLAAAVTSLGRAPDACAQDRPAEAPASANQAAKRGELLPATLAANHLPRRAIVQMGSGYDAANRSVLFRGVLSARIAGPLGLRVGTS